MDLPFFYISQWPSDSEYFHVEKQSAHHLTQVLRKRSGDTFLITDGKGLRGLAQLTSVDKKQVIAQLLSKEVSEEHVPKITLGIGLTRQNSRNEWLMEKLVELGVKSIYAVRTEHSVKSHFNKDRLHQIMVSAMQQSQRCYLPELHLEYSFSEFLTLQASTQQRLLAHCHKNFERTMIREFNFNFKEEVALLIGPEGDFSDNEIIFAQQSDWNSISLGESRRRTETAALCAVAYFRLAQL